MPPATRGTTPWVAYALLRPGNAKATRGWDWKQLGPTGLSYNWLFGVFRVDWCGCDVEMVTVREHVGPNTVTNYLTAVIWCGWWIRIQERHRPRAHRWIIRWLPFTISMTCVRLLLHLFYFLILMKLDHQTLMKLNNFTASLPYLTVIYILIFISLKSSSNTLWINYW